MTTPASPEKQKKVMLIRWLDSIGSSGWIKDHKDQNLLCESIGYYISENKESIKLAQSFSYSGNGSYADYIEIPKGCIKKKRWIRV